MIGKTISHYKILEELGRGGMGEVYLAEDLKLERKVAIKFLPQHLTKDKENVERFEREAKAAASLNHPNIVTIHEIAEVDDPATAGKQTFIVMEYVEGQTLREMLNTPLRPPLIGGKSDPSPIPSSEFRVPNSLNIITQITEGLSKAHQAGIVHRDIKPENILIDKDARVKILDFGLAKLKGVSKLTKESSTLGTVHYMSPEQIQGEDVDHRSDIWSVGVVLYEMLTGEPPFSGEYESAVHYAILNEEPKLYHEIEERYSSHLRNTVTKMIDKDKDKRYQDCREIKYDLEKCLDVKKEDKKPFLKKLYLPAGIIITIILLIVSFLLFSPKKYEEESLKSLAVLPFINEREDPETDYLGMALADEIIDGLSYLQNIVIRPSSSVRVYKGKLTDPISAGQDLNADFILSGFHLKAGDVIRLNIELVDVHNTRILWRDQIEERFDNAFKMIDDISEEVITGLKIELSPDEDARMRADIPRNSVAYDYYLRSLSCDLTAAGNTAAIEFLNKVVSLDSSYAPAFSELGLRMSSLEQNLLMGGDYQKMAEKYYLKALDLNNNLLTALVALSSEYTEVGKYDDAMKLIMKAYKINPNDATVNFRLSYLYRYVGMLKESEKHGQRALELDPTNTRLRSIGHTYKYLGKYQKSLDGYNLDTLTAWADANRGDIYLKMNNVKMAKKYFDKVLEQESETFPAFLAKGMLSYIKKDNKKGLQITHAWEKKDPYDSEMIYRIAANYSLLGDTAGCVRVLEKSINGGFFCYDFMLNDPFLDPVRNDPKFQELLIVAKEKHEAFKKKYFPEKR